MGDPVWPLRRWTRMPAGALGIVEAFLRPLGWQPQPRFQGKVRATRRSLIGELARWELLGVLRAQGSDEAFNLTDQPATCNALQNVTVFGAEAQNVNANDIAARVVCDGPMHVSGKPVIQGVRQGLFGACMQPPVVE